MNCGSATCARSAFASRIGMKATWRTLGSADIGVIRSRIGSFIWSTWTRWHRRHGTELNGWVQTAELKNRSSSASYSRAMKLSTILRIFLALQIAAGVLVVLWLLPEAPFPFAVVAGIAVPILGTGVVLAAQVIVGAIVDPRSPRTSLG